VELRWLTAFVTVAEELNYRRAAQRLFVAQPAVSQQIMNLEKELGVRLFDRNNRSVRLTDAGAAFLAPCREALGAVENAGLLARNAGTGEYGRIRVGFNAGFVTDHLVTLVQVLRRDHPHIDLVIDSSRRTPEILKMVREDRLDMGLVGGPVTGPGLGQRQISTTQLGVLLLDGHPYASSASIPVQALADEHLILLESVPGWSIRRMVEDALDRAGVSPVEVTTVADAMTMLGFVKAGIGVGFGSRNADALTPRNLTLVPLDGGPDVPTSVVWKSTNHTPALVTVIRAVERHLVDRHQGEV
jgi:DNA-binding transcriptional LysR family regulator